MQRTQLQMRWRTAAGLGGVIHKEGQLPRLLQGPFEGEERDAPIRIKECLAALFMLRRSGVQNAYVVLFTDNSSVYHSLRKFHSKHVGGDVLH